MLEKSRLSVGNESPDDVIEFVVRANPEPVGRVAADAGENTISQADAG